MSTGHETYGIIESSCFAHVNVKGNRIEPSDQNVKIYAVLQHLWKQN